MTTAFGRELLRVRNERGLSLAQLAKLVPCNRSYINQLEHGDRRPSPEFASKVDEVLGADGVLIALAVDQPEAIGTDDDEFEALELGRRAAASDVDSTTLTALEEAADR